MYNTWILTLINEILQKILLHNALTFLEFVAAKFYQNLAFVQILVNSYRLKIRSYIVYIVLKHKIYIVFRDNTVVGNLTHLTIMDSSHRY